MDMLFICFFNTSLACTLAVLCVICIFEEKGNFASLFSLGFATLLCIILGAFFFSLLAESVVGIYRKKTEKPQEEQLQFKQYQAQNENKLEMISRIKLKPSDLTDPQEYLKTYYILEQLKLLKRMHANGELDKHPKPENQSFYKLLITFIDDLIEIYTWADNVSIRLTIVKLPEQITYGVEMSERLTLHQMANYNFVKNMLSIKDKYLEVFPNQETEKPVEYANLHAALLQLYKISTAKLEALLPDQANMQKMMSSLKINVYDFSQMNTHCDIYYALEQLDLLVAINDQFGLEANPFYALLITLYDNLKNIYTWGSHVDYMVKLIRELKVKGICAYKRKKPNYTIHALDEYLFDTDLKCIDRKYRQMPKGVRNFIEPIYQNLRLDLDIMYKDYSRRLAGCKRKLFNMAHIEISDFVPYRSLNTCNVLKKLDCLKVLDEQHCLDKNFYFENPFYILLIKGYDNLHNIHLWANRINRLDVAMNNNEWLYGNIWDLENYDYHNDIQSIQSIYTNMSIKQQEKLNLVYEILCTALKEVAKVSQEKLGALLAKLQEPISSNKIVGLRI